MKHYPIIFLCFFALNAHAWTISENADITVLKSAASDLLTRTDGLKSRTINTLDNVTDISETFRTGLGVISSELSDKVRYGIEDINELLAMQREGLDAFLGVDTTPLANSTTNFDFSPPTDRTGECLPGSPCFQFREDLKALLTQIKELGIETLAVNEYPGMPAATTDINLDKFIALIDRLPVRLLYPIYVALVSGGADLISDLPPILAQARIDLVILSDIIKSEVTGIIPSPNNETFPQQQYDAKSCQIVIDNYTTVKLAALGIRALGERLKLVGMLLQAQAKTALNVPDLSGGFAEFANIHITLETDSEAATGKVLQGIGDGLRGTHQFIGNKITVCTSLRAQLNILDNQKLILRNL